MIARLAGDIAEIGADHCVIDVNGVGYVLTCSSACLRELTVGQTAKLTVETRMRADSIELYGFASPDERRWFRVLTTVQGVGAKVALALLSVADTAKLSAAILHADTATLTLADGVGPKLAKRIASELKDRLAAAGLLMTAPMSGNSGESAGATQAFGHFSAHRSLESETVSALVNLGYSRTDAAQAFGLAQAELGDNTDTATLLRNALARLARL